LTRSPSFPDTGAMTASTLDLHREFYAEADRFGRVYPRVLDVALVVEPQHFLKDPSYRDLGWYDPKDHTIHLVDRLRQFSPSHRLGIIRHELGHAADDDLGAPGSELRADYLAEKARGQPILYDGDDVQNVSVGVRRPYYLGG